MIRIPSWLSDRREHGPDKDYDRVDKPRHSRDDHHRRDDRRDRERDVDRRDRREPSRRDHEKPSRVEDTVQDQPPKAIIPPAQNDTRDSKGKPTALNIMLSPNEPPQIIWMWLRRGKPRKLNRMTLL